jgi:hypothetical protein
MKSLRNHKQQRCLLGWQYRQTKETVHVANIDMLWTKL